MGLVGFCRVFQCFLGVFQCFLRVFCGVFLGFDPQPFGKSKILLDVLATPTSYFRNFRSNSPTKTYSLDLF